MAAETVSGELVEPDLVDVSPAVTLLPSAPVLPRSVSTTSAHSREAALAVFDDDGVNRRPVIDKRHGTESEPMTRDG